MYCITWLLVFCVTLLTRLTGEKDALVQEITSFKDDIQKRQEYLDSLQPSLNTLLKVRIVYTCIFPRVAECTSRHDSHVSPFAILIVVTGFIASPRVHGYAPQ